MVVATREWTVVYTFKNMRVGTGYVVATREWTVVYTAWAIGLYPSES